jgi:flagellar hook protein FlgE
MMGSLFSSISGLKNHTTWMNVIGNNISNVNTVGYKESRITFKEAISQSMGSASAASDSSNLGGINPEQMGLGSSVGSIDTVMTQGTIQTTGNATDVAIDGSGFFIAKSGGSTYYTRAGNFSFDNEGNLVTSSGALVQGWQMKYTTTGAGVAMISTGSLDTNTSVSKITIPQNLVLEPQATSDVNTAAGATSMFDQNYGIVLKGNLDSMTPENTSAAPGAGYPVAGYTASATTTATVYDSLGKEHDITFDWTQTADTANGAAASWSWTAYDTTGGKTISTAGPTAANPNVATVVGHNTAAITFNTDGSIATNGNAAGTQCETITIPAALLGGATQPQVISVNLGTPNNTVTGTVGKRDGITGDFGSGTYDTTGVYSPKQTIYFGSADGYADGTLKSVSVDSTGGINCTFSNNKTITVAKLALANFSNSEGLAKAGGTMFVQTANSGNAQVSTAGNAGLGTTTGGALEASNVDLSVELTNMIIAQRGFESNARIVTTSSDMLTTLVNLGK